MVKAGKWLRSVLTGKKEKNQEKEMKGRIWLHLPPPPPPPPTTPEDKKNRNPAVAPPPPANLSWFEPELETRRQHSMALTSAIEVEDYVGRVAARKASFSTTEDVAAIMIQASFRSFLARKALRALKGLVKLQALVRGFLVRKQAAATLRSMQALLIAQARARARRVRLVGEVDAAPCRDSSQRRLMGEFNFQQLLNMDRTVDMIVEMDKGQSKGNSKSRKINTQSDTKAFSYQKFSSDPSALTDMSSSTVGRCSFHYSSPSHKPGGMRSPDKIIMSHEFPNYMDSTESNRAKARSQSAPRQRHGAFDQKQSCKGSISFGGRNTNRAECVQQSFGSTATKDQILWSGELDRSKRNAAYYRYIAA